MMTLPVAAILARDAMNREALSALPGAPVVPYVEPRPRRPRAARTRTALARLLERSARAVAPTSCSPAS